MRMTKNFLAGFMFMIVGGGAVFVATSYRLGTLATMGPGYFPIMLGTAITILGAILAIRSVIVPDTSEALDTLHIRPLLMVLAAVVVFGLLIRSYGLVVSVVALILISRNARTEGTWLELIAMLIVLTAIPIGVFVYGLGLPLKLWFF